MVARCRVRFRRASAFVDTLELRLKIEKCKMKSANSSEPFVPRVGLRSNLHFAISNSHFSISRAVNSNQKI